MRNLHGIFIALLVGSTVALAMPAPAIAQFAGAKDVKEISSYRLSESGLARYTQATKNLASLAGKLSDHCDDDETEKTLDQSVAKFDSIPGVRAAIQSAGMTTREYVVFTWSVFQTGMAAWALTQPGGKLPADVSMDNVNFYRKHEAAIQRLGTQNKSAKCDDSEEDNR